MGLLGRLTNLGKGLWKVKQSPDVELTEALEREIEATTSAEQKSRAAARLRNIKGGESDIIEKATETQEEDAPSLENPPKKTL